jgi:uncharacterized delta-60 repeat protein
MRDIKTCVVEKLEPRALFAAGALDPSFGQGGRLVVQFPGDEVITVVRDRALQPDGKIVISGDTPDPAAGVGGTDFAVGRLNPDGTPDTTFGGGDGVVIFHDPGNADSATGVALQPDGRIVAAATFTNNNDEGVPDYSLFGVLRFNPDGTPDTTWGGAQAPGVVVTLLGDDPTATPFDAAGDVLVDSAGRVIAIGGRTNGTTGETEIALVRYDPADGSLDPTFGNGGKVFARIQRDSELGSAAVFQPDGKLLVTGAAFDFSDLSASSVTTSFLTARFNPDGAVDTSFGDGGATYTDFSGRSGAPVQFALSDTIAIQPDGKVLVGGLVARGGSSGRIRFPVALARLNADGSPDLTFGRFGRVEANLGQLTSVNQIVVQDDGRILCSGLAAPTLPEVTAGHFSALVVQFDPAGKLDKSFGTGGRVIIAPPSGAASSTASSALRPGGGSTPFQMVLPPASGTRAQAAGATPNFESVLSQQAAIVVALNDRFLVVSSSGDQLNAARLIGNGPDLAVSPPTVGKRRPTAIGSAGTAVVRVVNNGNAPVPGAATVTLVLSADQTFDNGDRAVGSIGLGTVLMPRRRKTVRFRFAYPGDIPGGTYFVLAVADAGASDVVASNDVAVSATPVTVSGVS